MIVKYGKPWKIQIKVDREFRHPPHQPLPKGTPMPLITQPVIEQLIVPSVLRFFFVGGIFSLAVGIGLIVRSERMLSFFDVMNRWVSFRRAFKPLAIPRESWPFVQRYRRWLAILVIAGALFVLYTLATKIDMLMAARAISMKMKLPVAFVDWLLASAMWILVLGNLAAIAVGVMLGFFPNALASLEKISSRWISTRNLTKGGDAMHSPLEKWVAFSPKTAGWIIVVLAAIELAYIGTLLF